MWSRTHLWEPTVAIVISRIGILLIMSLASWLLIDNQPYHLREDAPLIVDMLGSRWDTGFYVEIAEDGYWVEGKDFPATGFFPLLPLLIRLGMLIVPDALVVGILVTNVALWAATVLLYQWVAERDGVTMARRTVWYFLIFPTAFFGSAVYSEPVFLLCALGCLISYQREKWLLAALCGAAATLSRSVGIILMPVLLVAWWVRHRQIKLEPLAPPLAVPVGLASYMLFLNMQFGDAMAFARAQLAWERAVQTPLAALGGMFRPISTPLHGGYGSHLNNWIDVAFALLFIVLGIILLKQKRWAEGVFVLCGVLMPLSTGQVVSVRRYVWILFPAFIVLAQWGQREWADRTITALSLLGLALFASMFALGYFVA